MGDVGDTFNDWKAHNKAIRAYYGVPCPQCKIGRPKTNASILLPGQRCKIDKYVDPRPRLSEDQIKAACTANNAPYFERTR